MNIQEVIKKVEHMGEHERFVDEPISKKSVLNILSQINESAKVVVPKFVAEWISTNKHKTLFVALRDANWNNSPWIDWVVKIGDTATPQEIFARAWLDGYEIEQEKLYTVRIPNPNRVSFAYALHRKNDGKIIIIGAPDNYEEKEEYHLTEAEIKQDFEWAWQWAKPVEVE